MIARTDASRWEETLSVERVNPQIDSRWDAFVASHPDGLVFHNSAWLRVIEESYGFEPAHLCCQSEDGRLRGVLPLFRVHGLITGHGLYSLPRTPAAGPLVDDLNTASALVETATQLARESGERLDLRLRSTWLDGVAEDVTAIPIATSYNLELPRSPAELRFGNSANHGKIRRAVNKAEREGVEVRPAETKAELRAWYSLYLDAMRWHATPPRPYRFFESAWDVLRPRGLMRLLVAERRVAGRTEMLAGSIFVMHGQTVFYLYNGRHRDALPMRPNDAIQWMALHDAHAAGFRFFDFGEVPEESSGLADFKAKWGAKPRHLYLYRYPGSYRSKAESHSTLRRTRRLGRAVWRRLPLQVTALLGNFIFSHL